MQEGYKIITLVYFQGMDGNYKEGAIVCSYPPYITLACVDVIASVLWVHHILPRTLML